MIEDPIVKEVREARDEHARRFGYDLDAIFRDLKEKEEEITSQLNRAKIIIGPWMMAVSGWGGGLVTNSIAQAVVRSPARKLLIPSKGEGWEWAGVEPLKQEAVVRQTVRAVSQILEGEEVRPAKPLSAAAIVGIVIGGIVVLTLLAIPLLLFFR